MNTPEKPTPPARCAFYQRTPQEDGYRYEQIAVSSREGTGRLHTPYPPLVGDLIYLIGEDPQYSGGYQVISRQVHYSAYGSADWPHGTSVPGEGPLMDFVVEPAAGVFRDEVEQPEEDPS